jgi:hypothetical protein
MISTAEHNRLVPKTNDLSVAPVQERPILNSQKSIALPEFALLLQKELEKYKSPLSEEDPNTANGGQFFEEFMTLLYSQNRMAREISENKPIDSDIRDIRHGHQTQAINVAGFRAYLQGMDRKEPALYMRYQNLYDSPSGKAFKKSF